MQQTRRGGYPELVGVEDEESRELHYFRSRQHEIDFLVSDGKGRMLGIEVKSGEKVATEDFRHLKWFRALVGEENFTGIVLYAGSRVISGGDGCYALPMSALWADPGAWAVRS